MRSSRHKCTLLVLACVAIGVLVLLHNWSSRGSGGANMFVPSNAFMYHMYRESPANDMVISLYPSKLVVQEGEAFQVTCMAAGAEQVYFKLPELEPRLLSTVQTKTSEKGALLVFTKAELGHQAMYTCSAEDKQRRVKHNTFEVKVTRAEVGEGGREEGEEGVKVGGGGREGGEEEGGEGREGVLRGEGYEGEEAGENAGRVGGRDGEKVAVPTFDTVEERAQYQRDQVDQFCKRHNLEDVRYELPTPAADSNSKNNEEYAYNRHLLLDDKHRTIFCFVPKVGCTNLKLLVFVSQGEIPHSELGKARDKVNQGALEGAMFRNSFISVHDMQRKQSALQSYYKYVMFRNPLERLASSYRSKVERFSCIGLNDAQPHFNWLRKEIFSSLRPNEYMAWKEDNGINPVNISFSEFIEFWLHNPIVNKIDGYLDEHFLTISDMCQPCRTRFDFYGNFNHFDRDAQVLVDRIGASSSDLRQGYYSEDSSTDQRMRVYYSTLTETQRIAVLKKLSLELEFYYSIFPEEWQSHKTILDVDISIPLS